MHPARLALPLLLATGVAHAGIAEFQLSEAESHDSFGTFANFSSVVDMAAVAGVASGTRIDLLSVSWDLTIATVTDSWLSEVTFHFDDADAAFPPSPSAFLIAPALGTDAPGSMSFSDTAALGSPLVLSEGRLYLEIFESFDDQPGITEALVSGTITLDYRVVPAPGMLAMLGVGVLALARRQRA